MRISAALVLAAAAAIAAASLTRGCTTEPAPAPGAAVSAVDTTGAAWAQRAAELERRTREQAGTIDRLRRALEGEQARTARVVVRYDTVLAPPDTVVLAAELDRDGRLTLDVGTRDSAGYRPRSLAGIELGDCDDGWSLQGGRVICDRARLGHLRLVARAGVSLPSNRLRSPAPLLAAALRWTPSYRSAWAIEAAARVDGRLELGVERHVRLW